MNRRDWTGLDHGHERARTEACDVDALGRNVRIRVQVPVLPPQGPQLLDEARVVYAGELLVGRHARQHGFEPTPARVQGRPGRRQSLRSFRMMPGRNVRVEPRVIEQERSGGVGCDRWGGRGPLRGWHDSFSRRMLPRSLGE